MQDLILHPTAAYAVPLLHCPPGKSGIKKPRNKPVRKEPTLEQWRDMVRARGIKVTTKHTKRELMAMFSVGVYIRPAALDRENARRASKKGC